MIIIKMSGGLGNQLFIYAFARSLAYDTNKQLYLDISDLSFRRTVKHIIYALHPYNIKAIVGNYSVDEYNNSSNLYYDGNLYYYENGIPLTNEGKYYEGFHENIIEKLAFPAYFTGYYSVGLVENDKTVLTEKFFIHNEDTIRKDLEYLLEISDDYKSLVEDIENHNSIAIHIRRKDYLYYFKRFGVCSVEYYDNAIKTIESKVENPKFFIFSDDMDWVKENINIATPHRYIFFEESKEKVSWGYPELLKIFSLCKHFIIANSTFSWWGSWLSKNKEKIIIAPYPWFQDRHELYPESISHVKPILIENTYKEYFEKSQTVLYTLDNLKDLLNDDVNQINFNEIILNIGNKDVNNVPIIKLSLKTYTKDYVKIYYHTKNQKNYVNNNSLTINYYKNDEFTSYLFLPPEAVLNNLKIIFKEDKSSVIYLKDFEIREVSINDYKKLVGEK